MDKIKKCLANEKEIKIMKKMIMISLVCAFLVVLTSCGIKNNEPDLVADLSKQDLHLQEKLNVKSVEIVKRNTDKENKKDEIYVKAIADGFGVECDLQYKLVYNYYTDGGWVLDECTPEKTSEWRVRPTSGVEEETIREEMQYLANNGNGYEDFFNNVSISSDKTFYNQKRHEVYLSLEQNLPYRELKAQQTCVYEFCVEYIQDGIWWYWGRNSEEDKYEIIEDNYDVICGEWYEKNHEHSKYEIIKVGNNKYKLIYTPFAYSKDPDSMLIWPREQACFETIFSITNKLAYIENASYILDRIYGIKMETKNREEFSSPDRVKLEFRDDGSIYLFRGIGPYFQGDAYLTKK